MSKRMCKTEIVSPGGRSQQLSACSPLPKQPWKPWPNQSRLPFAQTTEFSQTSPVSGGMVSPTFESYDAKMPPYFASASPRGTLPRLNLAVSLQEAPIDHSGGLSPSRKTKMYATPKRSEEIGRLPRSNGSLDSLFDTARHTHRKSMEKGWCTERSHRLARERRRFGSRFAPDRPPTVTDTHLPGVNVRYHQRLRTPLEERSAGERVGHAGFVTNSARQMLKQDLISPLLDMAVNSSYKELQSQAPPAISALAGVASNRAVLGAYGAVEMMLRLVSTCKSTATKLDAWDTLHQLSLSSEAVMTFQKLGGVAVAVSSSTHKDARVKRMAASTLERVLSKATLSLHQRCSLENIHALCKFVCCGDIQASESAGGALWSIAKHSVKEMQPWPESSIIELAKALVRDMEIIDEQTPTGQARAAKQMRGYTLTIKAMSLLIDKHKGARNRLCKPDNQCLTLLYKSLAQTGAMMGRMPSEFDLYYARAICTLGMSTRSAAMMNDHELITWVTAATPRLLFMLHDSMPQHWNERRKKISRLQDAGPEELEMQLLGALIANRNGFSLPVIRPALIAEGFLPTLLELYASLQHV